MVKINPKWSKIGQKWSKLDQNGLTLINDIESKMAKIGPKWSPVVGGVPPWPADVPGTVIIGFCPIYKWWQHKKVLGWLAYSGFGYGF